jgi:hypothetical protein
VRGFHEQIGDERQAVFHRHGALAFSAAGPVAVKSRPGSSQSRNPAM